MDDAADTPDATESNDRKDTQKTKLQFIWKVGGGLLFGFGFFCLLGYMVGYSKLANQMDGDARLFVKDILFAIGLACAVSFIFGFLLELPQTSDYVAEKLSDLMFGEEYLRRIASSLPIFRRRIDKVLFGAAEVASHQSLYNFMEGRLQALYRASFRRNMSVEIRCIPETNDGFLWRQKTSYTYVRNPLDPNDSIILSKRTLDVASLLLPATNEKEKDAFNEIVRRLYMRVGEHEYESLPDDRTKLKHLKKADLPLARMPEEIPVQYDFKAGKLNYRFALDLPMEMVSNPKNFPFAASLPTENVKEVFVEIHDDHRTLREAGNIIYAGVAAPTEDFSLDCFFPDGTRLEPARFFWQGLQKMADLRTEFGAISVKIPGWLLQGEGGCVAWFLSPSGAGAAVIPTGNETHSVGRPTNQKSNVLATPPDVSET